MRHRRVTGLAKAYAPQRMACPASRDRRWNLVSTSGQTLRVVTLEGEDANEIQEGVRAACSSITSSYSGCKKRINEWRTKPRMHAMRCSVLAWSKRCDCAREHPADEHSRRIGTTPKNG